MQKFNYRYLFLLFLMSNCIESKAQINYIAFGDSYTICTGAEEKESWPTILTKHLNEHKINIELIANPSRNGFSTQNLIDKELPLLNNRTIDFATVLIGVNDYVRNYLSANKIY